MTTKAAVNVAPGTDVVPYVGYNTHFQWADNVVYQDGSGNASPDALTVLSEAGIGLVRERLTPSSTAQQQAMDALTSIKWFAHPGDINSTETQIRNAIHAIATSARKSHLYAITGVNEPNNQPGGSGPVYNGDGVGWELQTVFQQWVIWDQVTNVEVTNGNWSNTTPGTTRPWVVGPGLMAAQGLHSEQMLDDHIAALAAATTVHSAVTYHMADLCDMGDAHMYPGYAGWGDRVNGKDFYGNRPPGVTDMLGSDGQVSKGVYEIQRRRQVYDIKITLGTPTSGHGKTFRCAHSEWGFQQTADGSHDADDWQARSALNAQEVILRDRYGMRLDLSSKALRAIVLYQTLNDPDTDGKLGIYRAAAFPDGAYPTYTAIQDLMGYAGGEDFTAVGSLQDTGSGVAPDCTMLAFSVGGGEWWLYVLREADSEAALVLDAAHVLEGGVLRGDGTYRLQLTDGLTIWHVIPTSGGGTPVWTAYTIANKLTTLTWTGSVAATGADHYSAAPGYALPDGLTLNASTGALGGTAGATGYYTTRLRATATATGLFTDSPEMIVTIGKSATFSAFTFPAGVVGDAYDFQIPYNADAFPTPTVTQTGGTLPTGLILSGNGEVAGVPQGPAGTQSGLAFAIHQDGLPAFVTAGGKSITITGSGGGGTLPVWDAFTPPDGQVGVKYGDDLDGDGVPDGYQTHADGGTEDCVYTFGQGAIPAGMVYTGTGRLRSAPKTGTQGHYAFTGIATDSAGSVESPLMEFDVIDNGGGGNGSPITYALKATNGAFGFLAQIKISAMDNHGQSARYWQIEDVNKHPMVVGKVRKKGYQNIEASGGDSLARAEQWNVPFGDDPSTWFQMTCVYRYDGTNFSAVFKWYDLESDQYLDFAQIPPTPMAPPYAITLGDKSGEVYVIFKKVRLSDQGQELAPIQIGHGGGGTGGGLTHQFTWHGGATTTSVLANVRFNPDTDAGKTVNLAWSTSADMTSPTLVGVQTTDVDAFGHFTVNGLSPDTWYYFRCVDTTSGGYFGEQWRTKTLPATTGPWTRKVAVISCQGNNGDLPLLAWQDVLDWGPDEQWRLGDEGYWGQDISYTEPYAHDLSKYDKLHSKFPLIRAVSHIAGMGAVCISDHELHGNGDGDKTGEDPTGAFGCRHTMRQMPAWKLLAPIRQWADTRPNPRFRSFKFDLGVQARVIVTDMRCPERSDATDHDGPDKQLWGAEQEAWLFGALDDTKVNIIVNETAWWWSTDRIGVVDKPARYPDAQQRLLDKLKGQGAYAGGPVYKVAWVGGDRHHVKYLSPDDGTDKDIPGPQWIGSGMAKNALVMHPGELYTWISFFIQAKTRAGDSKFAVCQWLQLTLDYDGVDTFTVTGNGRVANTERTVEDGVTTIGSTHVTSATADFDDNDRGMAIAGGGLLAESSITSVVSSTEVIVNQAADSSQTGALLVIERPSKLWEIRDYPGGTPRSDSWTVGAGGGGLVMGDGLVI